MIINIIQKEVLIFIIFKFKKKKKKFIYLLKTFNENLLLIINNLLSDILHIKLKIQLLIKFKI